MNKESARRLEQLLAKVLITVEDVNILESAIALNLSGEHFPSYKARDAAHDLLEDAAYAYWDLLDKAVQRGYRASYEPSGVLVAIAIREVIADPISPHPGLVCTATMHKLQTSR